MIDKFISCVENEYSDLWNNENQSPNVKNDFIPFESVNTDLYYEIRSEASAKALTEYKIEHESK